MPFNLTDVVNLLTILQPGRGNAMIAPQIEYELHSRFGFPISGNQHRTRALIKFAIIRGHLIKSSTANPSGFWLSNDKNEIIRNIESLKKRAYKTTESAVRLKDTWNLLHPNDPIL